MGQRLNLEIKNNKGILANAYYHWSGFTLSSLLITKQAIQFILRNKLKNDIATAVKILEHTGASFSKQAWERAKDGKLIKGEYKECQGRNDGLIGVSEIDIEETREWEEGRIEINIENNTFDFECAWEKNYIDDEDIWERIKDLFFEIKEIKSKYKIPFDKIDKFIEGVKTAEKSYNGRFYFDCCCFNSIY